MRTLRPGRLFGFACIVVSCTASGCDDALSISPATRQYVDACGRERFFKGANVVYKGFPWHPLTGPDDFDPQYSMNVVDAALWQSLGMNLVRLGVMWPGTVPQPNRLNGTYLSVMTNLTSMLASYDIWSLLDAHQDIGAELWCGEGFPTWAAQAMATAANAQAFPLPIMPTPFSIDPATGLPYPANCSLIGNWAEVYFADGVAKGFQSLYTNLNATRDAFAFHWASVARAWSRSPKVWGYELLNEPWAGDVANNAWLLIPGVADREMLQPFYFNLSLAVRSAEVPGNNRIISVETVTWDDFIPAGFTAIPGADAGLGVLNAHYYSLPNFNVTWQISSRLSDAARLGAGFILSEFDLGTDLAFSDIIATMDVADSFKASWTGWEYKLYDPITGADSSFWNSDGTVNASRVTMMGRTFPHAVAGRTAGYAFNQSSGAFSLQYTLNASMVAGTQVHMCTGLFYPSGYNVRVTSSPAGAVTWSVNETPGVTVPVALREAADTDPQAAAAVRALIYSEGRVSARGAPEPQPFAFGILNIMPVGLAFDGAQVYVSITATA